MANALSVSASKAMGMETLLWQWEGVWFFQSCRKRRLRSIDS